MSSILVSRPVVLSLLAGFILGGMALFIVHFISVETDETHYHANFALYVEGERDEFDSFTFYDEVQSCGSDDGHDHTHVDARAHMHDATNHVIHIHNDAVTWGHFFANLGYTLGDDVVVTDDGVFADSEDNQLTFLLNGEPVTQVTNQLIGDEDVLLVNYGKESADELTQRHEAIPRDAAQHNADDDPANCGGGHELTVFERAQRALGIR